MSFCDCCLQRSYAGRVVKQKKNFPLIVLDPLQPSRTLCPHHTAALFLQALPACYQVDQISAVRPVFPRWKKVSRSFCNNRDSSFKISLPPSLYSFILSSCTWTLQRTTIFPVHCSSQLSILLLFPSSLPCPRVGYIYPTSRCLASESQGHACSFTALACQKWAYSLGRHV